MIQPPHNITDHHKLCEALFYMSREDGGFFDFFRRHLQHETKKLMTSITIVKDPVTLHQLQGALQVLMQIEDWTEHSRDTLEALDNANRGDGRTIP